MEREERVNVAWPESSTAATPRTEEPSIRVTLPVRVWVEEETPATVAVKVTGAPKTAGLEEELSEVAVSTGRTTGAETVCVSDAEVEVAKLGSPE
jgi:hypothetical protein